MYILYLCGWVCLPVNGGSSPLALPNRINCPALFCAILFCSGSRSNDRIAITRDSHFHWEIFACQPGCLPLPPSQFVLLSLSYFFCFLVPSFILPNTPFLSLILSLHGGWKAVDQPQRSQRKAGTNLIFSVTVYIGVLSSLSTLMSSVWQWPSKTSKARKWSAICHVFLDWMDQILNIQWVIVGCLWGSEKKHPLHFQWLWKQKNVFWVSVYLIMLLDFGHSTTFASKSLCHCWRLGSFAKTFVPMNPWISISCICTSITFRHLQKRKIFQMNAAETQESKPMCLCNCCSSIILLHPAWLVWNQSLNFYSWY